MSDVRRIVFMDWLKSATKEWPGMLVSFLCKIALLVVAIIIAREIVVHRSSWAALVQCWDWLCQFGRILGSYIFSAPVNPT